MGEMPQGEPSHDLAAAAQRRAEAVTLRLSGMTYEQIANRMGYYDKAAARAVVLRALDRREALAVDEYRDVELARLERANAAIWPRVLEGDPASVKAFIDLSRRRSTLLGLDAPKQVTLTTGAQADVADALAMLREVVMGEVVELDEHGNRAIEPGPDAGPA